MNISFEEMATIADRETEICLSKMSGGSMGVFKDTMYPLVFMAIFEKMLKE